jgi:cytochrome c oxidase assembly protein Cox11
MYTKKNIKIVILIVLSFLLINLFFYSFITIGLYKLLCYDNNYLNTWISVNNYYNKEWNMYYLSDNTFVFRLIGSEWYKCIINNFFLLNEINLFFSIVYNVKINLFFYTNNFTFFMKNDLNLVFLNFYIRTSNLNWIHSISLQKTIILNLNESGLFFFRIYNPSHLNVKLITLYMIYPNIVTLYINKIQCFCFNVIFLYSLELVDLPVLIYINPFLSDMFFINNILIYYIIFLN